MQRVFHIISLLFLILTSQLSYAGDSRHKWIEKGDVFFQRRAEGHNEDWASIIFIEQALSAYLKAYDIGEPTPELVEKILWASYFYTTYAEKNPKKQKEVLQNAIKIGEEALKRYPNNVAINYQIAGCWGQWGLVNASRKTIPMTYAVLTSIPILCCSLHLLSWDLPARFSKVPSKNLYLCYIHTLNSFKMKSVISLVLYFLNNMI